MEESQGRMTSMAAQLREDFAELLNDDNTWKPEAYNNRNLQRAMSELDTVRQEYETDRQEFTRRSTADTEHQTALEQMDTAHRESQAQAAEQLRNTWMRSISEGPNDTPETRAAARSQYDVQHRQYTAAETAHTQARQSAIDEHNRSSRLSPSEFQAEETERQTQEQNRQAEEQRIQERMQRDEAFRAEVQAAGGPGAYYDQQMGNAASATTAAGQSAAGATTRGLETAGARGASTGGVVGAGVGAGVDVAGAAVTGTANAAIDTAEGIAKPIANAAGRVVNQVGQTVGRGLRAADNVATGFLNNAIGEENTQKVKGAANELATGAAQHLATNLAGPKLSPEQNELNRRKGEQDRTRAEMEEATRRAKGEANRNVEAMAGQWTEMAANNAANVAAEAQGGDTGAGAAMARMAAAQGARDKEGAANLQRAQQRKDTYEQQIGQREAQADQARTAMSATEMQRIGAQTDFDNLQQYNRDRQNIEQQGLDRGDTGPTKAGMDPNFQQIQGAARRVGSGPTPTGNEVQEGAETAGNNVSAAQQTPPGNAAGQAQQPSATGTTTNAAGTPSTAGGSDAATQAANVARYQEAIANAVGPERDRLIAAGPAGFASTNVNTPRETTAAEQREANLGGHAQNPWYQRANAAEKQEIDAFMARTDAAANEARGRITNGTERLPVSQILAMIRQVPVNG